ncbi:hypothetical protein R9C00_02970 [Flammeovirgaceae bacterium SG7u.111]|nr:hypothetical protein [Flammeovirgaceae bacterium SG7u.132]WPO36403.1 hypothetical protein R9C00_02970 [Flammeovirgaceae bacterium SG7u.111]
MKITKRAILLTVSLAANVLLIGSLIFMGKSQDAPQEQMDEAQAYKTQLESLVKANENLLRHNHDEAMEWYGKVGAVDGMDWEGLVEEFFASEQMLEMASDSLKTSLERLAYVNGVKSGEIDSLNTSLLAQAQQVDSLKQEMNKQILALNKSVLKSQELEEELETVQNAYGPLQFEKEGGKKVRYFGEVKDGKANGYGIGVFESKGVYEGAWKNNYRHGNGKYTWANGDIYEGEFVDGVIEGYGTYTFASHEKEKYVGNWKNGVREGKGVVYSEEGKVLLDGNWKGDKFERKHKGGR